MPAKENPSTVLLHLSDTEATTKLIRKDVDKLVQNIKDNLKLSFEAVNDKAAAGSRPPPSFADYHLPTAAVPGSVMMDQRHPPPPTQLGVPGGSSRKARSYMSSKGASRASPYAVPGKCDCEESGRPGSWAARKRYPSMSAAGKPKIDLDDPLEMLQELISEGNLLKEAVRRLQLGLTPKIQRSFYDSDEDCRTPPTHYTELREIGIN